MSDPHAEAIAAYNGCSTDEAAAYLDRVSAESDYAGIERQLGRRVRARLVELTKDPSAAIDLMEVAAGCLRARMPLPDELADWLATALSQASKAAPDKRGATLVSKLSIKGEAGAPTKGGKLVVASLVYEHDTRSPDERQGQFAALVAEVASKIGGSETTAKRRIREAREAIEANGPPPQWREVLSKE